jgi:hypothetical protein
MFNKLISLLSCTGLYFKYFCASSGKGLWYHQVQNILPLQFNTLNSLLTYSWMIFASLALIILGNASSYVYQHIRIFYLTTQHSNKNSLSHLYQLRLFNLLSAMQYISVLTEPSVSQCNLWSHNTCILTCIYYESILQNIVCFLKWFQK